MYVKVIRRTKVLWKDVDRLWKILGFINSGDRILNLGFSNDKRVIVFDYQNADTFEIRVKDFKEFFFWPGTFREIRSFNSLIIYSEDIVEYEKPDGWEE